MGVFENNGDEVKVKNNLSASNIRFVSPSSSKTRLYPLADAKNITPSAPSNRLSLKKEYNQNQSVKRKNTAF